MKTKKLGALAATMAVVGALALTGCGNSNAANDQGSAHLTEDGYALVNVGNLTVGTSAEYEPFEYMEDGVYKGFDVELATALADKLGLEIQIENVDFDTICPGVASGTKYDVGIAAITATPERKDQVDFTDSYYLDDLAVVTMVDNADLTGENCLKALNVTDVKVAVQSGSTAEAYARENFPNATLVPFKNATDCFAAVQSNQAIALVTNRSVAGQMVSSAFANMNVIKQIPTGEEYAIAVCKDNPQLTEELNQALQALEQEGVIEALMAKYNVK